MLKAFREYLAEKLNPSQGMIKSAKQPVAPENIVDFKNAYKDIEVVNRAVDIIINGCLEIPFVIEGIGALKKAEKILNIKPNPFEDRVRLFRRAYLDFFLDGNAFFYYDKSDAGNLYVLPANNVEVIPDEKTFVAGYRYNYLSGTQSEYTFMKSKEQSSFIEFKPDEIIHVKNDNSESIYRGKSRLASLQRIMELYYSLIDFQQQFFTNNAIPGVVLTTENVLSQKVKDRLLDAWKQNYTAIFQGARSPMLLDGGIKIDALSDIKFTELDFENSVDRIQQDMAKALGVPYVLLKSGNNANIAANEVLLYNHTVIPIVSQFCSAFSLFFDLQITPDELVINALQPDKKIQATYFTTLVNSGIMTPNEAREGLRLAKIEDPQYDQIRIPQNITGSATNASLGGRPTDLNTTTGEDTSSDSSGS